MKYAIALLMFGATFSLYAQQQEVKPANCTDSIHLNKAYTKVDTITKIMNRYTAAGIPGVSLAVYSEKEGWWAGAAGFSNIEKKQAMEICHLQYTQSVSKTYMAVAILKLKEEGKLRLDDPITKYLPAKYANNIDRAKDITVRMLLNQASGVPEYSTHPAFVSWVMLHPTTPFSAADWLQALQSEKLLAEPGAKYNYTNTSYLLLSLIADAITGDHAAYIQKSICWPLNLRHTFYENNNEYLKNKPVTDSYWDVLAVSRPANITEMQRINVSGIKGDDGIVCTPLDAVRFFKGLMEGRLLSDESLKEMLTFVKDEQGTNKYGMGIFYFDFGGMIGYGHGGGGIGAGCLLLYVPSSKTYLFLAVNIGVLVDSGLTKKIEGLRDELLAIIFR